MANKKQVERLRLGVEEWNTWRNENGRVEVDLTGANFSNTDLKNADFMRASLAGANFSGACLAGAYLAGANLSEVNFSNADLRCTDLTGVNLRNANLRGAKLRSAYLEDAYLEGADLSWVDLSRADLAGAELTGVDLYYANLYEASLSGAYLEDAHLNGANLIRVSLVDTYLGYTSLGTTEMGNYTALCDVDLSSVQGLGMMYHEGPCYIDSQTLERTAAGLDISSLERQAEIEVFLRGVGVHKIIIDAFQALIGRPIEYYSAFISYSHADRIFASRLYTDLQSRGIRCWLDDKDAPLGGRILDVVNQAIRSADRVLLCCSKASLTSKWVDREIAIAFEKEHEGKDILIPLDLDGYLFDGWSSGKGPVVRERLAGNFVGWKQNADLYQQGLERVVAAMRTEVSGMA